MPTSGANETLRFRDFELDVEAYQLRRQGRPVRLERRPMELLILLVEHRGRLVSRSQIADRLWGKDVFVDVETGVNIAISKVRQALRDSIEKPQCVETVVGKGYRFVAAVEVVSSVGAIPIAEDPDVRPLDTSVTRPEAARSAASVLASRGSRLAVGLFGCAATVACAVWVWSAARATNPVTLAVLPFANLTGNPDREYLADGLTEEAGRYYANQRTPATIARALEYYQQAAAIDPNYALAWSGIADALTSRPINSDFPPVEVRGPALEAAERAVRADPDLAEAQTALGRVYFWLEWDWSAAETAFRRAIVLNEGYAQAHLMLGHVLSQTLRHHDAVAALRRARELDPLNAMSHAISGRIVRVGDRQTTVVVDRFDGKRLNSPNDLAFGPGGALYFTDPPFGLVGQDKDPAKELDFNGVYRVFRPHRPRRQT